MATSSPIEALPSMMAVGWMRRDRLAGVKQHEELGKSQTGIFYDDERIISGRNFFFDNDGTGMDLR